MSFRQRYNAIPASGDVQQSMTTEKKLAVFGTGGMAVGVMALSFVLVAVALNATLDDSKDPNEQKRNKQTIKGCLGTVLAVASAGFVAGFVVIIWGHERLIGHFKRFARSDQQHYRAMKNRFQPSFQQGLSGYQQ